MGFFKKLSRRLVEVVRRERTFITSSEYRAMIERWIPEVQALEETVDGLDELLQSANKKDQLANNILRVAEDTLEFTTNRNIELERENSELRQKLTRR